MATSVVCLLYVIFESYSATMELPRKELYRLDFRRSLVSGLPSSRRGGWTRERQAMSVT